VVDSTMLRKVFGPKKERLTRGCRNLHSKELNDLHSLPNITRSQLHVYSVISHTHTHTHKLLVKALLANSFGTTIELSSGHYPRTEEIATLCVTLGWRSAPVL